MRCALSFDEDKDLIDQKVAAWGEMQSLKEEPCYREEDIADGRRGRDSPDTRRRLTMYAETLTFSSKTARSRKTHH